MPGMKFFYLLSIPLVLLFFHVTSVKVHAEAEFFGDQTTAKQNGFITFKIRHLFHNQPHTYRLGIFEYDPDAGDEDNADRAPNPNIRMWDYVEFVGEDWDNCGPETGKTNIFKTFQHVRDPDNNASGPYQCQIEISAQLRSDYNCNPGTNEKRCTVKLIDLTPHNDQEGEPPVTVDTSHFTVEESSATPSDLTIRLIEPIYPDQQTLMTTEGCPSGKEVKFYWWEDDNASNDTLNCIAENNRSCEGNGSSSDADSSNPTSSNAEGIATIQKTFENAGDYHLQVSCTIDSNNKIFDHISFRVNEKGTGHETIRAVAQDSARPERTVDVGQAFDIFLGGIGDGCYYIRVQAPDGKFLGDNADPTNGTRCADESLGDLDHKPYFTASNGWSPDARGAPVATITADKNGAYVVYLYEVRDDEGWRNTLANNWTLEIIGGIIGGVAGAPAGGIIGGSAGAAGGVLLANRIANVLENSKDAPRGATMICSGSENPDDCARVPDPKNPPCGNDIDANEGRCDFVNTSLGIPINVNPAGFIRSILGILLSISGGIAILLIMYAGYKIMTSRGNPEQVQSAREILTSAIVGLIFIIFSIVILQVITVDILQIPGFGN